MRPIYITAVSMALSAMVMSAANADTIRFWTTENQPARLAKQQEMAEESKFHSRECSQILRLDNYYSRLTNKLAKYAGMLRLLAILSSCERRHQDTSVY